MTFHYIPVIAADVKPFYLNGYDVLQIMEILKPGDVLVRGYDCYVDGKFIPDEHGYSHAGIYVGGQDIIHAVSPSVCRVSVVDFCQCDRIMVLRPCYGQEYAIHNAETKLGLPYDFNYEGDSEKMYCFELVSHCYEFANLETFEVKKFFGLIKRQCILAKSLYQSEFFNKIYEKNNKE